MLFIAHFIKKEKKTQLGYNKLCSLDLQNEIGYSNNKAMAFYFEFDMRNILSFLDVGK